MSSTSNPRFIPVIQPLDPVVTEVLRLVNRAARDLQSDNLLVGATARDLVFANLFGLTGWRATRDVDFGVAVETWEDFEAFKRTLVRTGQFGESDGRTHRLLYTHEPTGIATPVDLIPFGGVATRDGTISWPPGRDFVMNVAGFREALDAAIHVEIETELDIRVASIPGLTVLKLLAWRDRRNESDKDATDLARIIPRYVDAGNLDRIYGESIGLLEAANFDLEVASAMLLGRDAALICTTETRQQIRPVLNSERLMDALIAQMLRGASDPESDPGRLTLLVSEFREGFRTAG